MKSPRYASPHLQMRAVQFPEITILLDQRNGSVLTLSGEAACVWEALAETGDAEDLNCELSKEEIFSIAKSLIEADVIIPTHSPTSRGRARRGHAPTASWGTRESPVALQAIGPTSLRWLLIGAMALALVLLTRWLSPERKKLSRLRRVALSGRSLPPAEHTSARSALRAVRKVGRVLPTRVACLEESTATMVALRWAGYRARWRHGVAVDPIRLHAWIEVGGVPIEEPDDIADYTPFEEPV